MSEAGGPPEAAITPGLLRDAADAAAAAWAGPLDPDAAARAAGQLHASIRWLCAAVAFLAAAGSDPVLDRCLSSCLSAWRCSAAAGAPESGQGTGSGHGDLLCAAARQVAGAWSQRRPGQGRREDDLAGLAGVTAALARAATALAGQRPGTGAGTSLNGASKGLHAASGLLAAAAPAARLPAAPRPGPPAAPSQRAGQLHIPLDRP